MLCADTATVKIYTSDQIWKCLFKQTFNMLYFFYGHIIFNKTTQK